MLTNESNSTTGDGLYTPEHDITPETDIFPVCAYSSIAVSTRMEMQTNTLHLPVRTLWIWCAHWFSQVVWGRLRATSGLWFSAPCPSPVNYTKNSNCLSGLSAQLLGNLHLPRPSRYLHMKWNYSLFSAPLQRDVTHGPVSLFGAFFKKKFLFNLTE